MYVALGVIDRCRFQDASDGKLQGANCSAVLRAEDIVHESGPGPCSGRVLVTRVGLITDHISIVQWEH